MLKEKAKELGRQLIGQGREVEFNKDVGRYETDYGVSTAEAEKSVFTERFNALEAELGVDEVVDFESENYRRAVAGLREIFGRNRVEEFKADARDPARLRPLSPPGPISAAEYDKMRLYYEHRFGAHGVPDARVVNNSIREMQVTRELIERVLRDPGIRSAGMHGGPPSLEALLSSNPEIGADLGRIILAKEAFERHEIKQRRQLDLEKAMESLRREGKDAVDTMLWKAPAEWMKAAGGGRSRRSRSKGGDLMQGVGPTLVFMAQEARAVSKLALDAARAATAYVRAKSVK